MHPVILWGYRRRGAAIGQLPYVCPRCHQNVPHSVVKTQTKLTIFFIPLIPIGSHSKRSARTANMKSRSRSSRRSRCFPARRSSAASQAMSSMASSFVHEKELRDEAQRVVHLLLGDVVYVIVELER